MPNFFIEGYGCSLNKSDTAQISGFLESKGFSFSQVEKADFVVINTCAVKQATEFKMLKRIRFLFEQSKKFGFRLVVFGCLPAINKKEIEKISPTIATIGPSLEQLAEFFSIEKKAFSPEIMETRESGIISILPICRGCLGECSFCAVRQARGKLKSYSIASLEKKFLQLVEEKKEIWLTAQDTGCYGKDIGTSIVELLKTFLKKEGDYRIRIGMMNPNHLKELLPQMLGILEDKRVFLFLHIPFQSGSDKILRAMKRKYKIAEFVLIAKKLRKKFPEITLSTDIIVGFPGETETDFKKTLSVIKKIGFDIVNISRYGKRPMTEAAKMHSQVYEWEKKRRSRIASKLCHAISLGRNKRMVGKKETILVNENGKNNSFVGRTHNYKPVVITKNRFGKFEKAKITAAFPTYLSGTLEH